MKMERDLPYSSSSLPFPFPFINDLNDSNTNHEFDGTLHFIVPHLLTDFSIKTPPSSSDHYDHHHHHSSAPSFNFFTTTTTALIPLPTNLNYQPFYCNPLLDPADLTLPFDFFSKTTTTADDLNFHCLPSLHSVESPPPPPPSLPNSSSSRKRCRVIDSVQNYTVSGPSNPAPVMPNSQLARRRRQKLSEKMRCLQKLMPWDKKMDTATTLDEAYKYIQFLQAQVFALQSMPCESSYMSTTTATTTAAAGGDVVASYYNNNDAVWASNHGGFAGGLWGLNRQQLLQVLVNSPVAQTMLYSRGFCVFSTEQLALLKEVASRREALQHFSNHGDSSGTS